ncbi:MAG: TonB-dependent receptor [Ignavibacteriae bacterium]|nr:TonB-dependent receptor [Ignavibacteriota bacterium]NOG99343.1 TonB-dependent receptor [Ignavibacteriota bacterium]
MNKRFTYLIFIYSLFIFNISLLAGTTGKIVGTVIDAENGEPLPGINIIIENTTMGDASNIDGNYLINNVPPGSYTVTASGVGFGKISYTGVKVNVDFTTKLDFEMTTDVISVETVVVEAKTPLIREDLTSSYTQIDAEQIESLPVESINQILTLQAGVTQGVGGELHIRGGRSNEIAYSVNGVSISNPYNNSRTVSVATNAIQELSVVSGTFNAEYGNALSGIVNTVTKEGGNDYNGSLSFYTGDYLSGNDDIFYKIDDFDLLNDAVTEMTLSGPVPLLENKISFFVSGRMVNDKGYLNGIRQHVITDSVKRDSFNPSNVQIAANGDNEIVAMNSGDSYSTTGKLTFKPLSTLKINFDALYSNSKYQTYNHDLKYNPDANNTTRSWGLLNILEVRHAVSNSTFYTLRGSYNIDDTKRYLFPLMYSDGSEASFYAGKSLDGLMPDPRYQPDYKSTTRGAPLSFSSGGTFEGGSQSHFYQRTKILGAKFDLTSQLSMQHEVKFGGQLRMYNIASHYFEILRDTTNFLQPVIPNSNTTRNNFYEKKPFEFSVYLQDKMEFKSFIINVGLRYDYFKAKSQYSTNIFYPTPDQTGIPSTIDKSSLLANAEAKQHLSPRFGVSFPITDKGIIHFSYGHFYQLPPLTYLFANSEYEYSLGTPTYGNANLNPERTVSYEIGLQQQLFESLAFNVTGYYKDVRDLLAAQQIRISGDQTYFTYVNKDYANIKGIVFSLVKRRLPNDLFGFTLDYTFQTAEGNDVNSDAFFLDLSSGRQSEKIPVFLGWDKTHQLNATISIGEPKNWNVTLVGKIGTGLPYTPQVFDKQVFLKPNSDRRPAISTVDLLAEKSFDIYGFELTAFMKVFNLLDILNENIVYSSTGRSSYTLDETRGPALETNRLAEIIPELKTAQEVYTNPAYYLPPRQVRLGLSISF